MGIIKHIYDKIKSFFIGESSPTGSSEPTIEIRERNDQDNSHSSGDAPRITIGEVHQRIPTVTGRNIYRSEVDVQNPNLGHGIIVNKQHKPNRCPLCATQGKVVENTAGSHKWKCEECGSTFT